MRQAIHLAVLVLLLMVMTAFLPPVREAPAAAKNAAAGTVSAGYLEDVTFERLPGKERVTFAVTKISDVKVENPPGNMIVVRMENLYVPAGRLQRPLDAALSNVVRVTPSQKTIDGKSWVLAQIDLKQKVPYSVRQEGMNIVIDFNVATVPLTTEPVPEMTAPVQATVQQMPPAETAAKAGAGNEAKKTVTSDSGKKVYTGSRIFLDVQDADIKALLADSGLDVHERVPPPATVKQPTKKSSRR